MVAGATGYGVTITDAQRRLVWVNDSFTRMTGYDAAEAASQKTSDLLYFEGTDTETVGRVRAAFAACRGVRFEVRVRSKDGREWWLDTDARPLFDAAGVLQGWVCIQADVTAEVLKREQLRVSEANLRNLYDLSPLGIALTDMDGHFLQINRSFEIITGYSHDDIMQGNWSVFAIRQGDAEEPPAFESLIRDGRFGPVEMSLRRRDGSRVPVQIMGIIVQGHDGTRRIWSMLEDISVRKRSEQHISFLAYHDPLTSLDNRLGLRSRLEQLLRASMRTDCVTAVVLIDLDRFKYVNDTLGHDVGDELLIEVARRLSLTVRDADVVARIGGDEFVLVLGGLPDASHVDVIMQKIFAELRGNIPLSGRTVYSTCSIGVIWLRATVPTAPRCSSTRTWRCMPPRDRAEIRTAYSTTGCGLARIACRWRWNCVMRWSATSCRFTTSCASTRFPGGPRRSRRCCAGSILSVAWCCPASSFRSRKRPASSIPSDSGCWSAPARTRAPG
jgi:diguanylate cyclase (GGDEF)-like protein/PAS domain S-box-containing protein